MSCKEFLIRLEKNSPQHLFVFHKRFILAIYRPTYAKKMLEILSALLHMTSFSRVVNISSEFFLRLSNFAFLKNSIQHKKKHLHTITSKGKCIISSKFLFFLSHKLCHLQRNSKQKKKCKIASSLSFNCGMQKDENQIIYVHCTRK